MKTVDCRTGMEYCNSRVFRQFLMAAALCVLAGRGFAQSNPTEPLPDTIGSRVLACTACHGVQGQGTRDDYFPRLAGKPAGYLYNQLMAFRDGQRNTREGAAAGPLLFSFPAASRRPQPEERPKGASRRMR